MQLLPPTKGLLEIGMSMLSDACWQRLEQAKQANSEINNR